jgi:hypothetical protein
MTSRYAHIFDETLKNEFTKFQEKLVTNNGDDERICLSFLGFHAPKISAQYAGASRC